MGEVLQDYVKAMRIDHKLNEVRAVKAWPEVIGKSVANATTNIYIKNGVLFVHLRSSVVRNELSMIKEGIIKRMNEMAGSEVITDIVLR